MIATDNVSAFIAATAAGTRLLGIDLGTKTIGLALCDRKRTVATALKTLPRTKFKADSAALLQIVTENAIGGLVIGYPLNMNGTEGPRAQSTRAFAGNIARFLSLPALLWDERLSTVAVERMLIDADVSRARRTEKVDALAAAYILQGALDRMSGMV